MADKLFLFALRLRSRFACLLALSLCAVSAHGDVLINEVDVDQPDTDAAEFVELFNSSTAPVDLAAGGYVLVLYNGAGDVSYRAFDLTGVVPANGYFVIGSALVENLNLTPVGWPATNALQNGPDAVALFVGTAASAFPNGSPVTAAQLLDAVVYDTSDADDSGLITILTPGSPQVDENSGVGSTLESIQRIPNGSGPPRSTASFAASPPTPGRANVAPPAGSPLVRAYAFGGNIIAEFYKDPGNVSPADFTLTGNQSIGFIAIAGSELQRILIPNAPLAIRDSTVDQLTMAANPSTPQNSIEFCVYPPISSIQNQTIAAGEVVGIRGVVTGVRTPSGIGVGPNYALADAAGMRNGLFIEDFAHSPGIAHQVDLVGQVSEEAGVTTLTVSSYLDRGEVDPIEPIIISPGDFQTDAPADANPNEDYEGVLIRIDGLSHPQPNQPAMPDQTIFDQNVIIAPLFYDGRSLLRPNRAYSIVGLGYFSSEIWKILPRDPVDLIPANAAADWFDYP